MANVMSTGMNNETGRIERVMSDGTREAVARWGFEIRTSDGWSASAAGTQNASNCFATREEAEAQIAGLAEALEVAESDVRVRNLAE